MCMFENRSNIYLFNKQNYSVSISVDLSSREMFVVQCVFETGAGFSFIREDLPRTEWLEAIRSIGQTSLQSAINQNFIIVETVLLLVRMRDAGTRVDFGLVSSVTVPVLLGHPSLNTFWKKSFPMSWKLYLTILYSTKYRQSMQDGKQSRTEITRRWQNWSGYGNWRHTQIFKTYKRVKEKENIV